MRRFLERIIRDRTKRRIAIFIAGAIVSIIAIDQFLMPMIVHSNPTVTMPNVIGMPSEQAVDLLRQYGLHVQDIRQQYDSTQPAGRIVLQSPYPGATVRKGRRVYLVVSRGDETVRIPSLYGMTVREAQLMLLREGLQLGQVRIVACDSTPHAGVIEQVPPAGLTVRIGTTVDLTVCQDTTELVSVPNLLYRSKDEAVELVQQANLQLGDVILQHDETFAPGTVLRQEPAAGVRVPPMTIVRIWVASNL
jgi:beta-lactam-binding protein with PASTA domain